MTGNASSLLRSIRNYKFRSLFFKSLLLIFFLIVIPFLVMTLAIYSQMNRAVQAETSAVSMGNLQRVRDVMETIFYQMDHISVELINQGDVESFLRKPGTNDFTSSQYQNIYDKISMYTRTFAYIDSVYIYSDTNQYIISNRASTTLDGFEDRTWHAQVYDRISESAPQVILRMRNDLYPYYISFTRPAFYFGQKAGVVTSNIDIEELRKFLDQSSLSSDYLYITNADNQIVYSHNRDDFMLQASEVPLLAQLNLSSDPQSGMMKINGQNYIVTSLTSESDDAQSWRYISLLPLNRYDQRLHDLNQSLYWFLGIGGVVLLTVSIFLSLRSLSPINQIMSFIEGQDKVEFAMELTERKGLNELKYIINSIFRTMDAKRILQQELQVRQQLLNKAQTIALQTQINPHFLYNTLESIKYLAVDLTRGQNSVSTTVNALSDMIRFGLDTDDPFTDIQSELKHAETYLSIMKLRYPNRFEVEWRIKPEILDRPILKISLQPLLENAINHGILPARQPCRIVITGDCRDNSIELAVTDNGVGMEEAALEALNHSLLETYNLKERHIGIKNVNQRIKLIYGESYGLQVFSTLQEGTIVRIRLPGQSGACRVEN